MMCDDRAGSLVTGTRATLQLSQHERNASTQRDAVDLADFLGLHIESSRRDERSARHRWAHASQTWSGDKAWAWNDGWWWVMMRRKGISWLLTIEMSFAWLIHSFPGLLWEVAPPAWGDRVKLWSVCSWASAFITRAERALVFSLPLCNPFARSAGIFQYSEFLSFHVLFETLLSSPKKKKNQTH